MKIVEALKQLDPTNDDQWTADGSPLVEAVKTILGTDVTRDQIKEAAPKFNRATLDLGKDSAPVSTPWGDKLEQESEEFKLEKPAETQESKPATQEEDKPLVQDEEAIVKAGLEHAQENLRKAQTELKEAEEAYDAWVIKNERENGKEEEFDHIRQFQRSQAKQRQQTAGRAQLIKQVLQSNQLI